MFEPSTPYLLALEAIFGIPVCQWFTVDGEVPAAGARPTAAPDPEWERKKRDAAALLESSLGQIAPLPPKQDPIAPTRRRDEFPPTLRSAEAAEREAEYARSIVPTGAHTKPRE